MKHLPPVRAVFLGASNLTRCLPIAIGAAQSALGAPLDRFIAAGHGRSYGKRSRVLGRGLPGLLECGLWDALARAHTETPLPMFAVITDIGNDIMYGESADTIAGWVMQCVDQLREFNAEIVITQLPTASIQTVGPKRFAIVKSVMFPTRDISFTTAMQHADGLASRLRELTSRTDVQLLEQSPDWFGFDPIHIKPRSKARAWWAFCGPFAECAAGQDDRVALLDRMRLRIATPQRWSLLGHELGRVQPATTLRDGSRIHLF